MIDQKKNPPPKNPNPPFEPEPTQHGQPHSSVPNEEFEFDADIDDRELLRQNLE